MSIPMSTSQAKYDDVRRRLTYTEENPLDSGDNPATETVERSDIDTVVRALAHCPESRVTTFPVPGSVGYKITVPSGIAFSVETALRWCYGELIFVANTEAGAVFGGQHDGKPVVVELVVQAEGETI